MQPFRKVGFWLTPIPLAILSKSPLLIVLTHCTYNDIPELSKVFWERAIVEYPEKKKSVTLRVDADIIKWFKSKGKGYQTKINAILRSYYEAHKRKVP
jgi:uncharacterized protein (DUF4415 family)